MKLTYHKNIFIYVIILLFFCTINIYASDINALQENIAKEPVGSAQWEKLHKEYCLSAKKDSLLRKTAIAFYKKELEKKYPAEIEALLWEFYGEIEKSDGNHIAAVWAFTQSLNIYDIFRLQTKNKTWPQKYVKKITPLSIKRQQSFKYISRSPGAEEKFILCLEENASIQASDILQAYAIYMSSGNHNKFDLAKKCLLSAIAITEKNNGLNTEKNAGLYNSLAFVERRSGNIEKSCEFLFKALNVYKNLYGEKHLRVGIQYGRIGDFYAIIKDYKQAEFYMQKEIEYVERVYGACNRNTIITYVNLSIFYSKFDYMKAIKYCQKSVELCIELYGESHPNTLDRKLLLAKYYIACNEYASAKTALDDCLGSSKHIKNTKTRLRIENWAFRHYSEYYYSISDFDRALVYLDKAEESLPKKNKFNLARIYHQRAMIHLKKKNYTEALKWADKAYAFYGKKIKNSYTKRNYKLLSEIHRCLNNNAKAEKYERLAKNVHTTPANDVYSKLWIAARSNSTDNTVIKEYLSLLKHKLLSDNDNGREKVMYDLASHVVNSAEWAEKLVMNFDALEKELRDKKLVQERIVFLKTFSNTGFSELFPESRKNYFGNLEDTLYEEKLSVEKKLQALTVLASDYLRNETFFADGKEQSTEAIALAVKNKKFPIALKLYRITLRRLLQFNDDKFASIYSSAQKTADTVSDAKFKSIFNVIALLEQLKSGNGSLAVESLKRLYSEHPQEVSEEIISFLEYNPQFLSENKVDVLSILGCVSKETIAQTNPMLKRKIAAVLLHQNKITEAKQWYAQTDSAFERLLYLNTSADDVDHSQLSENFKLLEKLKPEAFELNNKKYSASDMSFLIWLTKCKYAKSLSDDALLLESAKQVDVILNSKKCSKDFISLLQIDTLTALFDYNYLLGDFQQAKEQIEKILAMKGYDAITRAHYLMRHGMCCLALKENKNAAKSLQDAGKIFHNSIKYKHMAVICYRNMACAEYRAGEYPAALKALRSSCAINAITDNKDDSSVTEAILIAELITLYNDKNLTRKQKALEFEQLRLRAKHLSSPVNIADFSLAEAFFRRDIVRRPVLDDQILALEKYFNYSQTISPEEYLRYPSFLPEKDDVAQKMLLLALQKNGNIAKLDFWNKKFEKNRVRSLTIPASSAKDRTTEDIADMTMLEIIAQCSDAKAIIETEKIKPQEKRDEKLIQTATSTLRRLENLFEIKKMRLAKEKADKFNALMADNFVIHPDSMNQLAAVLPTDTACLQFIPVDDEIIVYIISRNAPPIIHQIDLKKHNKNAKSFFNQVKRLRVLLQRSGSTKRVQRELNSVYKIIFADLEGPLAKMQTENLLVNSSGILRYIPFAALYDGKNFLVEKYQITNATGLDLVRLSRASVKRKYDNINITVFADPDGSLPSGRKEGAVIANLFKQKKIYNGNDASLSKLESLSGSVNLIHFATHGVIDTSSPRNSYIMMANGRNWRYCDMMGFSVEDVDSIVLSACNSAMSESCSGGEIEGMAYQLLKKSPSGSVVASFWKVDDKATSQLMAAYYHNIAESLKESQSLNRGRALRNAQLELLKNPATNNPYYWAAFTLFGDFR